MADPRVFPAGASLVDIARALRMRNAAEVEEQIRMSGIRLEEVLLRTPDGRGTLLVPLQVDPASSRFYKITEVIPATAAGLVEPVANRSARRRVSERVGEDEKKRKALDRFLDRGAQRLAENRFRPRLNLPVGAELEIQTEVVKSSPLPEQQRFLDQHPGGRILRAAITLRTNGEQSLDIGEHFTGRGTGQLRVVLEVPMDDYGGANWQEVHERLWTRLESLAELAILRNDGSVGNAIERGDFPPGTRVARYIDAVGTLRAHGASGEANLGVQGETQITLSVDSRWLGDGRVDLAISTLEHNRRGADAHLMGVGGATGTSRGERSFRTYLLDPRDESARRAVSEAVAFTGGLWPSRVDTQALDKLGTGRRRIERSVGEDQTLDAGASSTARNLGVGRDVQTTQRVMVEHPHRIDGTVVDLATSNAYGKAFLESDVTHLGRGLPGLTLERTNQEATTRRGAISTAHLGALCPTLGLSVVTRFFKTERDDHTKGLTLQYDDKDPQMVDVSLWRVDLDAMVQQFALEAGLVVTPMLQDELRERLRLHLFGGNELLADAGAREIYRQLDRFAERTRLVLKHEQSSTTYGYSSLRFNRFNLRDPVDQEAFAALVRDNDPSRALAAGKFAQAVERHRRDDGDGTELNLLGLRLLTSQREFSSHEEHQVRLGDKIVTFTAESVGVTSRSRGLIEDDDYEATHFVVREDGQPRQTITKMRFGSADSHFSDLERRQVEGAANASGLDIVDRVVGDGGWALSWLFNKAYGKGKVDMMGLLYPAGRERIDRMSLAELERNSVAVAAQLRGVTLPPSEVPLEVDGKPFSVSLRALLTSRRTTLEGYQSGLTTFDADFPGVNESAARQLTEDWRSLDSARKRARQIPELAQLPETKLDELLKRGRCADVLWDIVRLGDDRGAGTTGMQRNLDEYRRLTRELTGVARDGAVDAWVVERGMQLRSLAVQARLDAAKDTSGNGDSAYAEALFRAATQKVAPHKLEGDEPTLASLALWLTLFDAAGSENWLGLISAELERYRLLALSPGLDREQVVEMWLQQTPEAGLATARQRRSNEPPS